MTVIQRARKFMKTPTFAMLASVCLSATFIASLVHAGDAKDSLAAVRARRTESNAAIAAHDAVRLRSVLADNYLGIQGTSGDLDSGGEATAKSYADIEFKDASFGTYRRTPDTLQLAGSGKRIAESGHWVGIWRKPDGTMRKSGVYLARWVRVENQWRLRSELFITLGCFGSVECGSQN
jgi:ketosteroid isomerase-like protein